jgi:hypothetical protein
MNDGLSVWFCRSFRVGSVVLVLHDVSDVLLESAKLCKYSQMERSAATLFGLFTLSWVLLRLGLFPFWIIKSTRSSSYYNSSFLGLVRRT